MLRTRSSARRARSLRALGFKMTKVLFTVAMW
jgi:hypothetical protein